MTQPNNPLHGVTLQTMLEQLEVCRGWPWLAERVRVRCFTHDPSVRSSLTFLRRTPWAREKVETLYADELRRGLHPPPDGGSPA